VYIACFFIPQLSRRERASGIGRQVSSKHVAQILYLFIGLHASIFVGIVGNPMCHTFHVLSLLPGIGQNTRIFLCHA
jgi:hypothetical protein